MSWHNLAVDGKQVNLRGGTMLKRRFKFKAQGPEDISGSSKFWNLTSCLKEYLVIKSIIFKTTFDWTMFLDMDLDKLN